MENFTSQTNCKKTTRHKAHQIEDLADPEPNPAGDRTGLTEWKCGFAACAECKTLNNRKAKIKRQLPPAKLAQVRFKMAQLTVSSAGTGMEVGLEVGMEAGMGAGMGAGNWESGVGSRLALGHGPAIGSGLGLGLEQFSGRV